MLLEEHKRELHEALQAQKETIRPKKANVHGSGRNSKVYDLSRIDFDDDGGPGGGRTSLRVYDKDHTDVGRSKFKQSTKE